MKWPKLYQGIYVQGATGKEHWNHVRGNLKKNHKVTSNWRFALYHQLERISMSISLQEEGKNDFTSGLNNKIQTRRISKFHTAVVHSQMLSKFLTWGQSVKFQDTDSYQHFMLSHKYISTSISWKEKSLINIASIPSQVTHHKY